MNNCVVECVQNYAMYESTFPIEFIGGSRDGEVMLARNAPQFLEVKAGNGWSEVYERQNEEPPFVYVQIGYAEKEQWS
jgi:hypothetical protein